MRILFFNYEFPPIGGGAATTNYYLFKEFAKNKNISIDCITSSETNKDEVVKFSDNITLYRLNVRKENIHYWSQKEVLRWLAGSLKITKKLIRENRYTLSHGFAGFPSGFLCWYFKSKMPYLISLLGSDVPGFNPRLRFQYFILTPLFRKIWKSSEYVVANSIALANLGKEFCPALEVPVIPGGIDTQEYSPGIPDERLPDTILCISRLIERKGVHHLVDAMTEVRKIVPSAKLKIVGSGDMEQQLKRKAKEAGLEQNIEFLGYVPREELPALYRQSEIFAQPSFYEGMSNTILAAMASGLPIVSSGEGGREELFDGNALHVPFAAPQELAKALVELLKNQDLKNELGRRSRETSLNFSFEAIGERYMELYNDLASQNK